MHRSPLSFPRETSLPESRLTGRNAGLPASLPASNHAYMLACWHECMTTCFLYGQHSWKPAYMHTGRHAVITAGKPAYVQYGQQESMQTIRQTVRLARQRACLTARWLAAMPSWQLASWPS